MHSAHRPRLTELMANMARSIGARGQLNQQFEQCGHLTTIEQPDLVTSLLSRWLTDTRPA
jgi:hypothetical protein